MRTSRLFTRVLLVLVGLFALAAAASATVAALNLERALSTEYHSKGSAIAGRNTSVGIVHGSDSFVPE